MPDNFNNINSKRNRSELKDSPNKNMDTEDLVNLIKGLGTKMDEVNESVKEIDRRLSSKIDIIETNMPENIKNIKMEFETRFSSVTSDINDRFANISSTTQSKCEEIEKLTKELATNMDLVQDLNEARLHKLERDGLRNELIITGVPIVMNENVSKLIGDICAALNCNVMVSDVLSCYRIPPSRNKSLRKNGRGGEISSSIILKMVGDWGKNEIMSAYFHKKNLNTRDIGFDSATRIYINESLTKYNRSVFSAASDAKKSKSIFKCYTRNGLVHVQISEGGKIFRIESIAQLNHLLQTPSPQRLTSKQLKSTSSATTNSSLNQSTTTNISPVHSSKKATTASDNDVRQVQDGDMEQN